MLKKAKPAVRPGRKVMGLFDGKFAKLPTRISVYLLFVSFQQDLILQKELE